MTTTNPASKTSRASDIAEAQTLVRQCAEPCPAGTNIKGAIRKASRRTGMPYSRAKSIWYGEARRIEAAEMIRLRLAAESAELAQALAGVETLRSMLAPCIPNADCILAELASALRAHGVGKNEVG
jgi:hypothetical protein